METIMSQGHRHVPKAQHTPARRGGKHEPLCVHGLRRRAPRVRRRRRGAHQRAVRHAHARIHTPQLVDNVRLGRGQARDARRSAVARRLGL